MYRKLFICLLSPFLLFSCIYKKKFAIFLYNAIRCNEEEVKKFDGYTVSKRSDYYLVSSRNSDGCIVSDFKENEAHHLTFKDCNISDTKREEIYSLLGFMENHDIVSIRADFSATSENYWIELRTLNDEILVYYNDDIKVKNTLVAQHPSFKDIDKKWGYYLEDKLD